MFLLWWLWSRGRERSHVAPVQALALGRDPLPGRKRWEELSRNVVLAPCPIRALSRGKIGHRAATHGQSPGPPEKGRLRP